VKGFIIKIGTTTFTEVNVSDQIQSNISFQYWEGKHYSLHIETNNEKIEKIWKSCFFDRLNDIKITKSDVLNIKGPIAEFPSGEIDSPEDFDSTMEGIRKMRMSRDTGSETNKYSILSKLNSISITSDERQLTNIPVREYRFISIYQEFFLK